jgi:phage-related protein
VYTVRYEEVVFVLHCFQKKSKSGIAVPKVDKAVIETRLKAAAERIKELRDGNASR